MREWALFLTLIVLAGCAGVTRVPLEKVDKTQSGRMLVQVTVSDPHPFSPSHSRSWLEACDFNHKAYTFKEARTHDQWVNGETVFTNCTRDGNVQFATTSGYMDGLGSSALQSGAIVGGAALIGSGLSHSGSTTNQTVTGGNATGGTGIGGAGGAGGNATSSGTFTPPGQAR